jgi:hypothetical protein
LQRNIVEVAKCHFTPLKQAVRFVRDTGSSNIRDILHHDMMQIKLKSIYDGLLPSEQSALSKIVAGANDFTEDEMVSIQFLKQTKWLETHSNRLRLTIPILGEYVESLHQSTKKIICVENRLLLGDVPIDAYLSHQEHAVLQRLVEQAGQVVGRDAIAKAIWGETWEDAYSDWAIDQLISRLRKKCVELDLPKTTIQSVKGKGFRYE